MNSRLNCRSGGEGRELPPTTARQQFPALLSAPVVESYLMQYRKIEIPNKKFILDSLAGYGGSERDGPPT